MEEVAEKHRPYFGETAETGDERTFLSHITRVRVQEFIDHIVMVAARPNSKTEEVHQPR
jgi:hypothetical protein